MIYDCIVDGLAKKKPQNLSIDEFLQSLQNPVKTLRVAYKKNPVLVAYENNNIQAAYLTTYLPHYYQLIYKIFIEDTPNIFQDTETVNLTFIGGGPGSEAYGAVKYIVNNCPKVKIINIAILDINAGSWSYSHDIVLEHLIKKITTNKIEVEIKSVSFNLINSNDIEKVKDLVLKTDLLVIQNCLNEIANNDYNSLIKSVNQLFSYLPNNSYFLMSDLTSGARNTIRDLETILKAEFKPKFLKSTLNLPSSKTLISVHHKPSEIIVKIY